MNTGYESFFGKNLPKTISQEETDRLFRMVENGDDTAKDKIISSNLRLVIYIARKFAKDIDQLEEMTSIGNLGLLKATNSFNLSKNIKFATYASRCIENEILMYLRKTGRLKLEVSLDEPLTNDTDGNELTIADITPDNSFNLDEDIMSNANSEIIFRVISGLPERDRKVMQLRFLENGVGLSQKEVAIELGISQSYISRLEKKILNIVRIELERLEVISPQAKNYYKEQIKDLRQKEKIIYMANIMLKCNLSLKQLASRFGMSYEYVSEDILEKLPDIDMELYLRVCELIQRKEEVVQELLQKQIDARAEKAAYHASKKGFKVVDKPTPISLDKSDNDNSKKGNRSLLDVFNDYDENEIKNALKQLTETERQIIVLYYPLNSELGYSIKYIANSFGIQEDLVESRIQEIVDKTIRILNGEILEENTQDIESDEFSDKYYREFMDFIGKFPENIFLDVLNSLSPISKEIIEKRYALNGNKRKTLDQIAIDLNLPKNSIKNRLHSAKKAIFERLSNPVKSKISKPPKVKEKVAIGVVRNETVEDFLSEVSKYPKENFIYVLGTLTDINRKIIESRYGLNGSPMKTFLQISSDLNIPIVNIKSRLQDTKRAILKRLSIINESGIPEKTETTCNDIDPSPKVIKTETFMSRISKYTELELMNALDSLTPLNKIIIEKTYGFNGMGIEDIDTIAAGLGISSEKAYYRLLHAKKDVLQILATPVKEQPHPTVEDEEDIEKFMIEISKYDPQILLLALNSLNETERKIIQERYELNDIKKKTLDELSLDLNISKNRLTFRLDVIKRKLFAKLSTLTEAKNNSSKSEDNFPKDKDKSFESEPRSSNETLFIDLISSFDEEDIRSFLAGLSKKNRIIMEKGYGFNGAKKASIDDISQETGLSKQNVYARMSYLRKAMTNSLSNSDASSTNKKRMSKAEIEFIDLISKTDEEKIVTILNSLSKASRTIMEKRYGFNGTKKASWDQMTLELGTPKQTLYSQTNYTRKLMLKKLTKLNAKELNTDVKKEVSTPIVVESESSKTNQSTLVISIVEKSPKKEVNRETVEDRVYGVFERKISIYSHEEIGEVLSSLSETSRILIEGRFGINGKQMKSFDQMALELGVPKEKLYVQLNNAKQTTLQRLANLNNSKQKETSTSSKDIVTTSKPTSINVGNSSTLVLRGNVEEQFENLISMYKESTIIKALNSLSDIDKTIIEKRYGLNGERKETLNEISIETGISKEDVVDKLVDIRKSMVRLLSNLDDNETDEHLPESNHNQTNIEPSSQPIVAVSECIPAKEEVKELVPTALEDSITTSDDFELYRNKIKILIGYLKDANAQFILLLRLGYVNNKYYTEKEISEKLNLDETSVRNTINRLLNNIIEFCISNQSYSGAKKHLMLIRDGIR